MHTQTEKVGIVTQVIAYMKDPDNKTALAAKNFDVAPHILRLQAELDKVTELVPQQKKLEVDHIAKTSELQDANYTAYNDASGVIDAMGGLLGKGTAAANHLQTIRSRVRIHSATHAPTPTAPAPTSTPPSK
jgi:hypothetical protein